MRHFALRRTRRVDSHRVSIRVLPGRGTHIKNRAVTSRAMSGRVTSNRFAPARVISNHVTSGCVVLNRFISSPAMSIRAVLSFEIS